MFTVCPKCALTLVVTAADLKVGQGYVRCGRCSNVFNALVGLIEDKPQPGAKQPGRERSAPETEPAPADDVDLESVSDAALEFDADSTDLSQVFVEPRPGPHDVASGTFETIVLEADDLLAQTSQSATSPEPAQPAEDEPPPLPADAANDGDAAALQAANDASIDSPQRGRVADSGFDRQRIEQPRTRSKPAADAPAAAPPDDAAEPPASMEAFEVVARPERPWTWKLAWSAGAGVLMLALLAQLVHHHRHTLAVDARFREPLSAIYRAVGVALVPRWDLGGYDVRQLGATAAPAGAGGTLTVRASVQNGGDNPQPLPFLRVIVQDRFGNRIAARDVAPAAYAPRIAQAGRFLDAGERVDAEIRLADPGPNAVGFELDACLPADGGRVACANEQRSR
jgi:predicted Zn finger-like uncharacterized protein